MAELVFDTNVWRAVPEERRSQGWWRRNMTRLSNRGHTVHASVVNIVELGSHIYDVPPARLRRYREAFQRIEKDCAGRVLPDPETEIEVAFGVAPLRPFDVDGLRQVVRVAARAPSPEGLQRGFNCTLGAQGLVRARAGQQSLADFRAAAQGAFVQDVVDHVIDRINPGSVALLRAGAPGHVADANLRQQLVVLINGPTTLGLIAAALRAKVQVGLVHGRLTQHQGVPPNLDAYARYYITVLQQVVQTGYDPVRRQNDFWDWQLLAHLQGARFLVTNDANLRRRVAGSPQAARVITLDDIGQV